MKKEDNIISFNKGLIRGLYEDLKNIRLIEFPLYLFVIAVSIPFLVIIQLILIFKLISKVRI